MPDLSLFRHGKSSWDDPDLDDFDRPLAERGAKSAPRMARWFAQTVAMPEVILCSSAVRTRATLALALNTWALDAPPEIMFEDDLYLASANRLRSRLAELSADITSAMVIGHNPGMHALALELTGSSHKETLMRLSMKFPTAAIAQLHFNGAWADLRPGHCRLGHFETPKRVG